MVQIRNVSIADFELMKQLTEAWSDALESRMGLNSKHVMSFGNLASSIVNSDSFPIFTFYVSLLFSDNLKRGMMSCYWT